MDPIALAEQVYANTQRQLAAVRPEQLGNPTPCPEWDLRALINHIIGSHYYFGGQVSGHAADPSAPVPDFTDDPEGNYIAASKMSLEAFRAPGALDKVLSLPMGETPAGVLLSILAMDNLVHGWDVAKATGQETEMDPGLATGFLENLKGMPLERGPGKYFGAEVTVPDTASPTDKLVAFLGRQP